MATPRRRRSLDRTAELRSFIARHPHGWSHDDWNHLVERLREAGYDVRDPDEIGRALERERLRRVLQAAGVPGLGPRRQDAIAERFGTIWALRGADAEAIAATPGINRALAERIVAALG